MGKLGDRARERSPYLKIEVGGSSPVLIYKSWKEIVNNFGNESFRYTFEVETSTGFVTKSFDSPSNRLAIAFDKLSFGTKVILHRKPMVDPSGNEVEGKTFYEIEEVGKGKVETDESVADTGWGQEA